MPFERGPDEIIDLPQYLRQRRQAAGSLAARHPHLRRDRRCAGASRSSSSSSARRELDRQGRATSIDIGCQPDVAVPASGRDGRGAEARGLQGQRRFRRRRGAAPRRAGRRRLRAEPRRDDARCRRRHAMRADPGAEAARRSRLARCAPSTCAKAKGIPHIADPVLDPIHFGFMTSLERYARAAPRAARRRDPDGHRQPDRADRRRQPGRHGDAARHLLGARRSATCSSCRCRRTRAARSRSTTRRAA